MAFLARCAPEQIPMTLVEGAVDDETQPVRPDRHREFRRSPGHAHHGRSGRVRAQLDHREDTGRNPGSEEARRPPRPAAISGSCTTRSCAGAHRAWRADELNTNGPEGLSKPQTFDTNIVITSEQAFGKSLDPDKLERLGRYEVHLDRKLERMLAMLLRLKDLRQGAIAG